MELLNPIKNKMFYKCLQKIFKITYYVNPKFNPNLLF